MGRMWRPTQLWLIAPKPSTCARWWCRKKWCNIKLTNSQTYQHTNLSTHKLINSQACKLTNLSTHNPINSQTYKPTSSSTHKLINLKSCQLFGMYFNILSALFVHQSSTLPQIIDSREGWFWCKKGWVVNASKMNIYFKEPPFAPYFGLFSAKFSAFWC